MRPLLFAAAIAAVATVAQAQATWTQQRFAEAGFTTEAPVRLSFDGQSEKDGWVLRNYLGRDGDDIYLVVAGRRQGAAAFTDAQEAEADGASYAAGFEGGQLVYNRPGPGPSSRDVAVDWQGRRFFFRSTHRHPWAVGATYATPLPVSAEGNARAQRFLSASHISE